MLSRGNIAGCRSIKSSISSPMRKPKQSCTFYMDDWWLSFVLIDRNLCKPKPTQHSARLMLVLQLESVGVGNLAMFRTCVFMYHI